MKPEVQKSSWPGLVAGACLLAAAVAGCEFENSGTKKNAPGSPSEGVTTGLRFDPSSAVINASGGTASFTLLEGNPPFVYTVDFPEMGGFSSATSTVAKVETDATRVTYTSAAKTGVNTLRATDRSGRSASASIVQGGGASLVVTPAPKPDLLTGGTFGLSVTGGQPPLTWSVSNAGLGSVRGLEERTAEYTASAKAGSNVVRVRDALGLSAECLVTQTAPAVAGLAFTVDPTTIALQSTAVLTATGGVAPYTWAVGDPAFGTITVRSQTQAVYRATNTSGYTVIQLRDGRGTKIDKLVKQGP